MSFGIILVDFEAILQNQLRGLEFILQDVQSSKAIAVMQVGWSLAYSLIYALPSISMLSHYSVAITLWVHHFWVV